MTITSGTTEEGNNVTYYLYKKWYRQSPLTPDPLPYQMVTGRRFNVVGKGSPGWDPPINSYGLNVCQNASQLVNFVRNGQVYPTLPMDRLYNQTYEKFVNVAKGDVAELLVNLAERKEAFDMMRNRFIQIINAVRAFRRLEFGAAARALGVTAPSSALRKRWREPRQWASNWLEWHFGWSPTLSDIYSVTQILDATFPWYKVVESSGWKLDNSRQTTNGGETINETFKGFAVCKISGEIEVSDLTLLKANQLGLINPASVVWELIPFSFLADWFGTIGLWLGSFTDFLGLTIRRPQHVYFANGTGHYALKYSTVYQLDFDYRVAGVVRALGIPGPTIALRRLKALSVTRGLTAISLILGLFAPNT